MPSPFPGMDPFLEHPALWPDVHNALIAAIRADLTPKLRPRYVACLQERIYELEEDDSLWIADLTLRKERHGLSEPRASYGADHGAVTALLPMPEHARETSRELCSADPPAHGRVRPGLVTLDRLSRARLHPRSSPGQRVP